MIAQLKGVGKEYQVGDQTIIALHPLNLEINTGELVLIIGPYFLCPFVLIQKNEKIKSLIILQFTPLLK